MTHPIKTTVRWDVEEQQVVYAGETDWKPTWIRVQSFSTRKSARENAVELGEGRRVVKVTQKSRQGFLIDEQSVVQDFPCTIG